MVVASESGHANGIAQVFLKNGFAPLRRADAIMQEADGKAFLIITREITYTNQDKALLCITRQSSIRR